MDNWQKCQNCNKNFDCSVRIPKILINCGHTICELCLSEMLKNKNNFECPIDHVLYQNIESTKIFPENKAILQQMLNAQLNNTVDNNNDNFLHNSINLQGKTSYIERSNSIRMSMKCSTILISCSLHSLPLDVICIDEKKKICKQCALLPEHSHHIIITDEEFMNQIDKLIDLFSDISMQMDNYYENEKENISSINILNDIFKKFDEYKKLICDKSEEIINLVNKKKNEILLFLENRKKELRQNYENISIDLKSLFTQTKNWMSEVKKKLDILNEIEDPKMECIKLIDDDQNKNLSGLFNIGHQINDRYSFIHKTEETIKNLDNYNKNGLLIEVNNSFCNFFLNEDIIKINNNECLCLYSKLFNISENENNAEKLKLQKYKFKNFDEENFKNLLNDYIDKNKSKNLNKNSNNIDDLALKDSILVTESVLQFNTFNPSPIKDNSYPKSQLKNNIDNDILINSSKNEKENTSENNNQDIFPLSTEESKSKKLKKDFEDDSDSEKKNTHYPDILSGKLMSKSNNDLLPNRKNKSKENILRKSIIDDYEDDDNSSSIKGARNTVCYQDNNFLNTASKVSSHKRKFSSSKKTMNLNLNNSTNNLKNQNNITDISNFSSNVMTKNRNSNIKPKIPTPTNVNNISPPKDKIVFIKSQINKDCANFSRVDIGEDGMNYICELLNTKNYPKFKELKLVRSNINDDCVVKFINCLINNNINVTTLNLQNNSLTDKVGEAIVTMLNKNKSIKNLNLNNNSFSVTMKEKIKSYSTNASTGFSSVKIFI